MAKVRVQIAPEIEFKLEMEVHGVDAGTRDFDVQQHKAEVYEEFVQRLQAAFPVGFRLCAFEFGLDRGWHGDRDSHGWRLRRIRGYTLVAVIAKRMTFLDNGWPESHIPSRRSSSGLSPPGQGVTRATRSIAQRPALGIRREHIFLRVGKSHECLR